MKKLLITGGSGFLGQSILPLLSEYYKIKSIGIDNSDDYELDLSANVPSLIEDFEVVIHAAGKAHSVPRNEKESDDFFSINLQGTKNLCKALEKNPPKAFIFISTVAVYGVENGEMIDESHELKGTTPYALSKIRAEEFLINWCKTHNVNLGILRPSLIAGKNPPGNLGAMISGLQTGKYLRIGKGACRKSILMAEDIAHVLPLLIKKGGIYNVCDNHHPSFFELEKLITTQLGIKSPNTIPYWAAKAFAVFGDLLGNKAPINSNKLNKLTKSLTFSNEKAKRELNWEPMDVIQNLKIK